MSSKSAESLEFLEETGNTSEQGKIEDLSSADELNFISSERNDDNVQVSLHHPRNRGIEPASQIPLDDRPMKNDIKISVDDLITGAMETALTDMEKEFSPPDTMEEVDSSSGASSDGLHSKNSFTNKDKDHAKKTYSSSSFHTFPDHSRKDSKSGYDRYARNKRPAEGCKKISEERQLRGRPSSKNQVNFIARNKSMVSSPRSHATKISEPRKRPLTSTWREREEDAKDNRGHIAEEKVTPVIINRKVSSAMEDPVLRRLSEQYSKDSNSKHGKTPRVDLGNKRDKSDKKKLSPAEWAVLNECQLDSFRKLFSRFDQTKSGGISANELYVAIKELMPSETVAFEVVKKVHDELDLKHTGEIEFDEFLFAMTNPRNYLNLIHDDDRKQLTKEIKLWEDFQNRKKGKKAKISRLVEKKIDAQGEKNGETNGEDGNIFFTMLRTATNKDSMKEIRHFYVNKIKKLNDHVIHDWSEGQRCIGLSDQDVLRRYNHIMKELKDKKSPFANEKLYQESPYAQPLYWGLAELKLADAKRKSIKGERIIKDEKQGFSSKEMRQRRRSKSAVTRTSSDQGKKQTTLRSSDDETRHGRVGDVPVKGAISKSTVRAYSARPTDLKSTLLKGKREGKKKLAGARPRRVKISEFVVTPKAVSLPVYPVHGGSQTFNYDNVIEIRKRAADILQEYYNNLKKVSATNSKVIYKKLQVEQMSPLLRSHFKKSYIAYSGEYEPFVVSPWIPYPVPSPWKPYAPLGVSKHVKSAWT